MIGAIEVRCPFCGEGRERWCRTATGVHARHLHADRLRAAHEATARRELDCVHGLEMMQPRCGFAPEQHLAYFMGIFHPEHPINELPPYKLRGLVGA